MNPSLSRQSAIGAIPKRVHITFPAQAHTHHSALYWNARSRRHLTSLRAKLDATAEISSQHRVGRFTPKLVQAQEAVQKGTRSRHSSVASASGFGTAGGPLSNSAPN